MPALCFATNNPHKLHEVRQALKGSFDIVSLKDIGCTDELPETGRTLEHNSWQKANYVKTHFGVDCFADDTGLEVPALNGEPGVDSAHYAGPQRSHVDNMAKLLQALQGQAQRQAQFRTVMTLLLGQQKHVFEGIVKGHITQEPQGTDGFGYDPIFVPQGHQQTFAQMPLDLKNTISHRGRAVQALSAFLLAPKS